jgi:hypothetical protein
MDLGFGNEQNKKLVDLGSDTNCNKFIHCIGFLGLDLHNCKWNTNENGELI